MKILVVVDMQNDFINGSLGTKEAEKIVPNVIKKIKEFEENKDLIIYTKDTHYKDYLTTPEGLKLPVEHCIKDTSGWEIPIDVIRDNKIVFQGVSSEPMLDKDSVLDYSERFKKGTLLE